MDKRIKNTKQGFTIMEVSIVLGILGILLLITVPGGVGWASRAREATLKQQLSIFRETLDKFYTDQKRYPETLEELVDSGYLRMIPIDPFTESRESWRTEESEAGKSDIYNIHSGSTEMGRDGTPLSEW